jgi:hypothetical protein
MQYQYIADPSPQKRVPWSKGKLTGAKPPLRPKHVWSIRTKLQIECHLACHFTHTEFGCLRQVWQTGELIDCRPAFPGPCHS